MKTKKILIITTALVLAVSIVLGVFLSVYYLSYRATATFDFSKTEEKIKTENLECIRDVVENENLTSQMLESVDAVDLESVNDNDLSDVFGEIEGIGADENTPNSNWWLLRWFSNMNSSEVNASFEKGEFSYAVSCVDDEKIELLFEGKKNKTQLELNNLSSVNFASKKLQIDIECAVYKGALGAVFQPVSIKKYTVNSGDTLRINIDGVQEKNIYHISIIEADESAAQEYETPSNPQRYAFDGKNETKIKAEKSGYFDLDFIYLFEDEKKDVTITVDGESFACEFCGNADGKTCSYSFPYIELKRGKHTVKIESEDKKITPKSVVISPSVSTKEETSVCVLNDREKTSESVRSFIVIAPESGEYSLTGNIGEFYVTYNGKEIKSNEIGALTLKLNKGINYIDVNYNDDVSISVFAKK